LYSLLFGCQSLPAERFIETESFTDKGGWVVDQQFTDLMGSSYLLAHGMGQPVNDASTEVVFARKGAYRMFVRTYNWTSPWHDGKGPGQFQVLIDGNPTGTVFGDTGTGWFWQDGGEVYIADTKVQIRLHDLTGFDGRCDAIYFTQDSTFVPPSETSALSIFRNRQTGSKPKNGGSYDLVVTGGGVAGICAAVSAARLGMKVALIHDRPVWGGNNSSEVRVHLGGRIALEPYPELGGIVKELSPEKGGNAQPAGQYEDEKKTAVIDGEPNITQFMNYRAFAVRMKGNTIRSITAKHIETGEELVFTAPLFADCTGDGTIGVLAGADFAMGRESKADFGEPTAPDEADELTMGSSVQWYSEEENAPTGFPVFNYGMDFNEENVQRVTMGEWTWETGMNLDQITDFERIRDYGLLVVYSNWSFLKNEYSAKDRYANRKLGWVAYLSGKRESRRLLGDIILKEQDIVEQAPYPDGSAATSWSIDLHYPDPENTGHFPGGEFKSIAVHQNIYPYPIPYRCLYSRNVDNLFMAGRHISVTHVALGTVRVMRTTGMMGEVVGMAASLCKQHNEKPRGVYENRLEDLKTLMKKGVGKEGATPYPDYNQGGTLQEESNNPITVACYYFPNYHTGDTRNEANKGAYWSEWELVKAARPRFEGHEQPKVPQWGYGDERNPQVMAQKIDAAANHGIDAFIFDWYYYDDGPFLQKCLEEGFLKAPNAGKIKFSLMWANHDWIEIHPYTYGTEQKIRYPGKVTPETYDRLCDYVVDNYFTRSNYWSVDGKPYFSVYDIQKFVENFGSLEATKAAMNRMREKAINSGLKGVHWNLVVWGNPVLAVEKVPDNVQELLTVLGFDSATSYVWIHHTALRETTNDYNKIRDEYITHWDKAEKDFGVPYFPNVTMGWDSSPRTDQTKEWKPDYGYPYTGIIINNTPGNFKNALQMVKNRLLSDDRNPRIMNINCWNEWTEGSYLEPDTKHGMQYLNAIKEVFGEK
jgi:hypothetical protein